MFNINSTLSRRNFLAGAAALVAGIIIAWRGGGLITVAASCCGVAFAAELLLGLL